MKTITYWLIQIPLVLLAVFGGKEIATATRTSKELIELKDQKIELLEAKSYEEKEMDRIDGMIERLETNELYQGSVYKGLVLVGLSLGMGFLHTKFSKTKKRRTRRFRQRAQALVV